MFLIGAADHDLVVLIGMAHHGLLVDVGWVGRGKSQDSSWVSHLITPISYGQVWKSAFLYWWSRQVPVGEWI